MTSKALSAYEAVLFPRSEAAAAEFAENLITCFGMLDQLAGHLAEAGAGR
jgi:hypothetical protein